MSAHQARPGAVVICADTVILDKFSEKITTVGMVDSCACAGFPAPFNFCAIAKIWGLPPAGNNHCVLRLMDLAGEQSIAESPVHTFHTNLQGAAPGIQHTAVHRFAGEFGHAGLYEVQVVVNGAVVAIFPLSVGQIVDPSPVN